MATPRRQDKAKPKRRAGVLPSVVRLGRGFEVHVVLVSPSELAEIADDEDEHLSAGAWVTEDMTIYIDSTLPRARQWATYWHEMLHAIHDIAELDNGGI
jgi:hypothetical protein